MAVSTRTQLTRRLQALRRRYGTLTQRLGQVGPIKRGSIYKTYSGCGSPGCRCHKNPKARHGPYWFWTSKTGNKSHCRKLDGQTLKLYRRYAANYKKLKHRLQQLEAVSDQILDCQLELAGLDVHARARRTGRK